MLGAILSNRYEILREIGRGGMGVVYLARDPALAREVAIKVITPALLSPEAEARFRREARLIAQMDHPGIVGVYDIGDHGGSLYLVMPYVRGTNLRALMNDDSLNLGDLLDLGIQVAEALEYSHSNGVVHRDIKPENILVMKDDHRLRLRITDFGLAMASTESRLTKSGALVGTVSYLSPEQIIDGQVDARADIYALGTLLYECLVGKAPFSGEIQSVLYRIAHETPQSPRSLGAEIREELEVVVMQCLEKHPAKRPQRAQEVAEALLRHRSKLHTNESSQKVQLTQRSTTTVQRPMLQPFVGRDKEQAELQRRLNAAVAGECQFVVVCGEAGIGKSRMLDEIENLARARKIRVLHGRFVEQDQTFPYQGFCDVILEFFRQKSAGSAPFDFSDLAEDLVSLFPMLREIEDVRSSLHSPSPAMAPPARQKLEDRIGIFELIASALIRMAEGRPLVLLLEDLHAADVSIDALQYIVRRLGPTPTLIVATYRTEEVTKRHPLLRMLDSFQGERRFALIRLERFWPSEHRAFLETILGGTDLDLAFVEKIYESTEGNPYFTKELVRSLLDSGRIIKTDTGVWNLSGETALSTEALPETIHQTVQRRIEQLPKGLRDILSAAAVAGRTFEARDVSILIGKKAKLEEALERLLQTGFIEEMRESGADRFTFSSGVVREVLYAELSRAKRKGLHRKYAEELETRNAGRLERFYSALLHHYQQAAVPAKIAEYGLKLARNSLESFYAEDGIRAATAVLDSIKDQENADLALEGEAHLLLAQAHRMLGNVESSLRECAQAIRVFEKASQSSLASEAIVTAANTAWEGRKIDDTSVWVEKGLATIHADKEPLLLVRILILGATLANLRGDVQTARQYAQQAEQLQAPAGKEVESVSAGGRLIVALPMTVPLLHPATITLGTHAEVYSNVFESLVTTDGSGNLLPSLCERWESPDGGKTFIFALRPGILLHDGRSLTAQLVRESLEKAILAGRKNLPAAFGAIAGVDEFLNGTAKEVSGILSVSAYGLEIRLSESLPIYPALLTDWHCCIASENEAAKSEEQRWVGTGAFQIEEARADALVLKSNPSHWTGKATALDSIEFRGGVSAARIADGFRSGEFDLVKDLSPEDLDDILRDRRLRPTFVESPMKNTYVVLFNKQSAVARIPFLRWAMSGVVRIHDLVRGTLGRFAQPAEGLLPPGILGHDPGKRKNVLTRDKVLELLESSRLQLPIRLRAAIHPVYVSRFASLTQALFKIWADVGIEISNETPTWESLIRLLDEPTQEIDLLLTRLIPSCDDPDDFTYGAFHSESGLFRNLYSSKEMDSLIQEARQQSRQAWREKMYRKIETLLLETGFALPLFHEIDYRLAGPRIKGIKLRGTAPYVNYSELGKVELPGPAVRKGTGGVIHVPMSEEISDLDPCSAYTVYQAEVILMIFDTLTRDSESVRILPWLVSEFHSEEGGRRYRLRLREEARFHDGRRVHARDVRYSFEHLLSANKGANRWFLSPIAGAKNLINGSERTLTGFEIVSASEFTIALDEPVSFFPALLAHAPTVIVSEGMDRFDRSWTEGCVGTGPYRVIGFEPRHRLDLEPNPYHWRRGFPKNDRLTFSFGVRPEEALEGFRKGVFSLTMEVPPSQVEPLRRDPAFNPTYRDTPRLGSSMIAFNIHRGPLADEDLRHHLVRTVNVDQLVRRHFGRMAIPARGVIPPGLVGYEPVPAVPAAHLRRGGPSEKITLTGLLSTIYEKANAAVTAELFENFSQAGFQCSVPWSRGSGDWDKARTEGNADFHLSNWIADYPDTDSFIGGLLHSEHGFVGRFCGTPEIDRLIEKGRTETSPEIRHDIYREVEEIIARRALVIPLFHLKAYGFARPEVEGFEISFTRPIVSYEKLWIRR